MDDISMEVEATLAMERVMASWEQNQMMCHDNVRALRHMNEQLENSLMALEDARTMEYQDIQWYYEQDQQVSDAPMEPDGHTEPASVPTDPGEPTDPGDPLDPKAPEGADSSAPTASEPSAVPKVYATESHKGYDAWSSFCGHYGRPYQDAPWRDMSKASASHPPSTEASPASSALGATAKAKAKATGPAAPRARPSENKFTRWRAKMAYILVLYENHQWAKIEELIQGQEDTLRNHPDHNKGWKVKALSWITNWKAQKWHSIDQLHRWCLGPKINTFSKYVFFYVHFLLSHVHWLACAGGSGIPHGGPLWTSTGRPSRTMAMIPMLLTG